MKGCTVEGPTEVQIDTEDNGNGCATVTYWPVVAGEYAIHVTSDDDDIPGSPYMADVLENIGNLHPDKVQIFWCSSARFNI